MTSWQVLAASATGVSHTKQQKGNEDAFAIASSCTGDLVLVASDGAGSAKHAAQGSAFLSQTILKQLSSFPNSTSRYTLECDLLALLYKLKSNLDALAKQEGQPAKAFAATLLAVKVMPFYTLALQLGDGAIIMQNQQDELSFLTQAFHGEYASETTFVSSPHALKQASTAVAISSDIKALALLTDGLEPVALQNGRPFKDFFEPLFKFATNEQDAAKKCRDLESFLSSERLNSRTHDDKTLIVASR